jgi:phenylalanyl-tRNA synthetase beta chain
VEDKTAAGDLVRAASGADKTLIASVNVFDVYRGPNLPEGKMSVAIEVTLQPKTTLRDEDIQAVMVRIIAAVTKATGGALRG